MKKILALSAVLAFLIVGGVAAFLVFSGRNLRAQNMSAMKVSGPLTGEVVCLTCYLGHGASGEAHASCAKQCLSKGLPVGLKVGDKLYLLVGMKHHSANKMMAPYAGRQVTVTGKVVEQDGMGMIEVEKVAKAG